MKLGFSDVQLLLPQFAFSPKLRPDLRIFFIIFFPVALLVIHIFIED